LNYAVLAVHAEPIWEQKYLTNEYELAVKEEYSS